MAKTPTKPAVPSAKPVAAPAKPVAAPAKPVAAPAKPVAAPAKPVAPAAAPPAGQGAGSAILAEIAKLTATLAGMQTEITALKAAKAKAVQATSGRTAAEITEGVTLDPADWRAQYQGFTLDVYSYDRKGNGPTTIDVEAPRVPALLALPRDADKGGVKARSAGLLALHWERGEDGRYTANPDYVTREELALIWPE